MNFKRSLSKLSGPQQRCCEVPLTEQISTKELFPYQQDKNEHKPLQRVDLGQQPGGQWQWHENMQHVNYLWDVLRSVPFKNGGPVTKEEQPTPHEPP